MFLKVSATLCHQFTCHVSIYLATATEIQPVADLLQLMRRQLVSRPSKARLRCLS